jgi:hypothetical protein
VTLVFRGKRIRIQSGTGRVPAGRRNLALAAASLLAPCVLLAFALTCWSVAADLHWTERFFVSRGVFSHWQSWLIASSILLLVLRLLHNPLTNRF